MLQSESSHSTEHVGRLDKTGTRRQRPTMSTMTVNMISIQSLVRPLLLAASSAANNNATMALKTDGKVRIDTVPPQLDLASAFPEIHLKFDQWMYGQLQNDLTNLKRLSHSKASLVTWLRCEQARMFRAAKRRGEFWLHQISSVAEHDQLLRGH